MKSDHIKDVQREFNVVFSAPSVTSANAAFGINRIASIWRGIFSHKSLFSYGLVFLVLVSISVLVTR